MEIVTLAGASSGPRFERAMVMLVRGLEPHERVPRSVVSDADVLRRASSAGESTASVDLVLPHADQSLADAAALMARHAVVVDRGHGRPLGVLSSLDVMRLLGWGRA